MLLRSSWRYGVFAAAVAMMVFSGCVHSVCVQNDEVVSSTYGSLINASSLTVNGCSDVVTNSTLLTNTREDQWLDADEGTIMNAPRVATSNQSWRTTYNDVRFYVRGVFFAIVTTLGIVGNILTLIVLHKGALHSSSTVYLMGLSISDILFLVVFAPTVCKPFDSVTRLKSYKTFYSYYVVYVFPLVNTLHTSGVWIMICFTVERFIAVTYPMKAQKICTSSRARIAVVLAVLFGIVLNSTRFFRRSVYEVTDSKTNETYMSYKLSDLGLDETYEKIFFWVYTSATKFIPFPLLTFFNCSVIWRVWEARTRRRDMTGKVGGQDDDGKSREKQISRLLIGIIFAFLICNVAAGWASLYVAIEGSGSIYINQNPAVFYLFLLAETLVNSNPLVNVIVYTTCSSSMRTSLKNLLCPAFSFRRKTTLAESIATAQTAVRNSSLDVVPEVLSVDGKTGKEEA